jgi:hypothetical protein
MLPIRNSYEALRVETGGDGYVWADIRALALALPKSWADPGSEPNRLKGLLGMPCCLCVTTLGRDWQLQNALPLAIWLAWNYEEVTVYVVDFNQHDTLQKWVLGNLALPIKVGKLKYYRCTTMGTWHASLAKNTVHMAACRDTSGQEALLVNLDGDNVFTTTWLRKLLTEDGPRLVKEVTVIHYQNPADGGTYGRLAYLKSLFMGVRGYDTEFLPMGCQDTDLLLRLGNGGKVLNVKNRWVGISFCSAPKTGNDKVDRQANFEASTPHSVKHATGQGHATAIMTSSHTQVQR